VFTLPIWRLNPRAALSRRQPFNNDIIVALAAHAAILT
jgi:hypothetical protein